MILELNEPCWLGTEATFYEALALEKRIEARLQAGPFEEVPGDYLLQKQGSVGLVNISGPLINADHPILAFFGISTYPAIRRALVSAAKDQDIKNIVLAIDSGGGAVNGVADTADLISRVAKVKPVTTVATGTMASAAYWLGVSAGKVHASKTSEVGSIGILAVHIDRSKQLEDSGIKATVLRAGKYKSLLNPFEPLSEEAKEQVQEQLDAAYRLFMQHVADSRGLDYSTADRKMGQGRVFFGAAAADVGLVDSITTLDAVISELTKPAAVDKRRAAYDNGIKGQEMKKNATLTEQELAALASGAALEAGADEIELNAGQETKKEEEDGAGETTQTAQDQTGAAAAGNEPAAPTKTEQEDSALVAFLRAQLKEKENELVDLRVELRDAKAKLESIEATHNACVEVVRASIQRLRVALGGSAGDVAGLGAVEALAEHDRLMAEFKKKFKVGGVAAAAPQMKDEQKERAAAPLHAARIAAVRLNG